MKRFSVFFLLLLTILLSSCAVTKVNVSSVTSGAVSGREASPFRISFSEGETRAMSNYMLGNRFSHSGKTLFGSRHDEYGRPYLCRMKFTAGQSGMYVRETETIERNIDAQYLIQDGSFLYYLREAEGSTSVARIPLTGSSPEILYTQACDFLSLRGERLYFTDAAHHLMSSAKDGSDLKAVLTDKAVFYPYLITDDILLYQDDADGESLRMRYLPTGFELKLSEGHVYSFILEGSMLYYLRAEDGEEEKCRLYRIDLNEFLSSFDPTGHPDSAFAFQVEKADGMMGPRFSVNGSAISTSDGQSVPLDRWMTLTDTARERDYSSACQYVAEGWEIFYDYNREGLITDVRFYEPALKRSGYIEHYRYL